VIYRGGCYPLYTSPSHSYASLFHPIRQTHSTTLQLPINCDPRNYGTRLRNMCIRMSAPSTSSYCTALTTRPHCATTTQLLLRGIPRPSSPPATGFPVWTPVQRRCGVLVAVLRVRPSIRPSVLVSTLVGSSSGDRCISPLTRCKWRGHCAIPPWYSNPTPLKVVSAEHFPSTISTTYKHTDMRDLDEPEIRQIASSDPEGLKSLGAYHDLVMWPRPTHRYH
jgi:hypothetical protein